jgi:hypothetical protein
MARRRVNPMKFALMGAIAGIAKNLTEEWATERARKAKALEMAELRAMNREDKASDQAFQLQRDASQSTIRTSGRKASRRRIVMPALPSSECRSRVPMPEMRRA